MNYIAYLTVFLLTIQLSSAQKVNESKFPDSYFGIYTGEIVINSEKGLKNYPMEFHLLPTDSLGVFNYMIVYGKDENRQERKYTLKEKDKAKGIYTLDENNGILLDCKVIENRMYFLFEVMDNLLTTFIVFNDEHLVFEIVVTDTKQKNSSGGQDKDTPEVISYPITGVQKAVLNKQ